MSQPQYIVGISSCGEFGGNAEPGYQIDTRLPLRACKMLGGDHSHGNCRLHACKVNGGSCPMRMKEHHLPNVALVERNGIQDSVEDLGICVIHKGRLPGAPARPLPLISPPPQAFKDLRVPPLEPY